MPIASQKINPCLWFDTEAEEAAKFYCSVFKNSKIGKVSRYVDEGQEIHGKPAGSVMAVEFELEGQKFAALNGGPQFKFDEAISFQIACADQQEVDYFWSKLSRGRQGSRVRLAEGQIRPVLAGRSHRALRHADGPRPRQGEAGHQRFLAYEEIRHRRAQARLRRRSIVSDSKVSSKTAPFEFVIKRTFNAPLERVWKAWTDPNQPSQMVGPQGFRHRLGQDRELKPGGMFHYQLRSPHGQEMWGKFVYREIVPQERLVYVISFSDPEGGLGRHPLSTRLAADHALYGHFWRDGHGKTTVTVKWVAYEATEKESETFEKGERLDAPGLDRNVRPARRLSRAKA